MARERGEAAVEFIVLTVCVAVPVLSLVLALSSVQAAVFASEAGAREAARVLAVSPDSTEIARAQVDLAFADYGLAAPSAVEVSCVPAGCTGAEARIRVRVATSVPLPLVPAWAERFGAFPVAATSESLIDGMALDE